MRAALERAASAERGRESAVKLLARFEEERRAEKAASVHVASTLTGMLKNVTKRSERQSKEARDMVAFQKGVEKRAEREKRALEAAMEVSEGGGTREEAGAT